MKIVILAENTVFRQGILAEHGLSLYIEKDGEKYLFDTGQTGVFLKNAKELGVDLADLDGIILSHGHYDHCGGLAAYAKEYPMPPIYVRKEAFGEKYHQGKKGCRQIGIPFSQSLIQGSVVYTKECQEIAKDVFVLGKIPAKNEFEGVERGLMELVDGELRPDGMADEQMLVIRSEGSLNVFLGCSHVGVANALDYLEEHFPHEHIHLLLAGMHLSSAGMGRLERTAAELEKRQIDMLVPLHCTGIVAAAKLKEIFGERCKLVHAGTVLKQV